MNDLFRISADLIAMQESIPIRFVHNRSMDQPEKHVLHINNYVEIYVYIEGDHQYIVENSLYKLKKGDIVIINPREVHKALLSKEVLYERFYFLVDLQSFDRMHLNPLLPILNKLDGRSNLISFDESVRPKILNILYGISDCFKEGKDDQLRALSLFLSLLDEIDRFLKIDEPLELQTAHTPEVLKRILRYVADHTAELQSITEISDALGFSPQYLSSYFSHQVGTPLKTYIQAKKIALAKELLSKGADVTEACYDCGFNDCSYFIKVFKKYVGATPMSYKRRVE